VDRAEREGRMEEYKAIWATDIKAHGTDTFLQFIEHNSDGNYKAIPLDTVDRIEYVRPYFVIMLI
jgi:hypothetical protein